MFKFLRLAMQVFLKPYSIQDKVSCKKFLLNTIALIKPLAVQTKTTLDDGIVRNLEYVLANDALFEYFYKIIFDQFQSDEVLFESIDEKEVIRLVEEATPLKEHLPEAISPLVIITLVSQIISIINAIKTAKTK